MLAAFNFGDTALEDYTLTLPRAGKLTLLFGHRLAVLRRQDRKSRSGLPARRATAR